MPSILKLLLAAVILFPSEAGVKDQNSALGSVFSFRHRLRPQDSDNCGVKTAALSNKQSFKEEEGVMTSALYAYRSGSCTGLGGGCHALLHIFPVSPFLCPRSSLGKHLYMGSGCQWRHTLIGGLLLSRPQASWPHTPLITGSPCRYQGGGFHRILLSVHKCSPCI